MTDFLPFHTNPPPADEPRRDTRLGALLRDLLGEIPMDEVRWDTLAGRVSAAVRARQAPWWSYAERWQRRAIPLALAAGLFGATVLVHSWVTHPEGFAFSSPADMVSAVVAGTPAEDAATLYTHAVTSVADLSADVLE
jgi:uncharacterized membrane protein